MGSPHTFLVLRHGEVVNLTVNTLTTLHGSSEVDIFEDNLNLSVVGS